jgi:hypothetical protein
MKQIPKDMIVPAWRRDISNSRNVAWLLRNLTVQNKHHPDLGETINMLMVEWTILATTSNSDLNIGA